MLYSEIKHIRELVGNEWRNVVEQMQSSSDVYEGCYRFIEASEIDQILGEELASDPYVLGCFNAWFIADILDIETEAVTDMQNGS